jgi:hypothetical protein
MACNCKKKPSIKVEVKTDDMFLPSNTPIEEILNTNPEIENLIENSKVLIHDINHPVRKTFIIPVGEPVTLNSFKEKIMSFLKKK